MNLDIPAELITENSHEIMYELLDGKKVIGLCGYAGSGKDSITAPMVERLGFKRIAFGDMLKIDMDNHMKVPVYEDLIKNGNKISFEDINFFSPKDRETKEILRPYVIWFAEEMRRENGVYHWINKAFLSVEESEKIVISDVRRLNELEIFEDNREYLIRLKNNRKKLNIPDSPVNDYSYSKNYESLLIHVNQRNLQDHDSLTVDTIITAHEKWLFDYTVYIDSKIPDSAEEKYREKHMSNHLMELVKKFPEYFV